MSGSSRVRSGGFLEPIGNFEGKRAFTSVTKGLSMTNGTRPYKTAYGHDMSCPYVINHTLFDDQTTAVDKPEFAIKIGTLKIDGVKDADIDDKCIAFELTERIGQAGGGLDADSNYIVYVCYDKDNVYFACDAEDDVTLSSDVKLGVGLRDSAIHT